jgi:hypothetical protein
MITAELLLGSLPRKAMVTSENICAR